MNNILSLVISKYIKIGDSKLHWNRKDWTKIKQKVYSSTIHKYCWICAKPYDLQFHHLRYDRLSTPEEIEDIVIVCSLHHYLCHYTLFTSKLPLKYPYLHARYIYLQKNRWRRIKPSHIINWFIRTYSLSFKRGSLPYFDYPFKGVSIG